LGKRIGYIEKEHRQDVITAIDFLVGGY